MSVSKYFDGNRYLGDGAEGPQGPPGEDGADGAPGPSVPIPVLFGSTEIGADGPRYLMPGYSPFPAGTTPHGIKLPPSAYHAVSLSYYAAAPGFGSGSYALTLVTIVAGVATTTGLSLTIAPGDYAGTVSGSVALAPGSVIGVQIDPTGDVNSPVDSFVVVGLEP